MAVMTAAHQSPRATNGCAVNWSQSLAEHRPWLARVIAARTGEPQSVEEVWQQIALAVVEQRWPLGDPSKVAPWLHRLAVVASARYRRQLGRSRKALAAWAERQRYLSATSADPLGWLLRQERLTLTREAMARLDGRDAEVLLLKYGERWSYRQIAEHLGITEKAVDCRLLRARERLRRELSEMGIKGVEE